MPDEEDNGTLPDHDMLKDSGRKSIRELQSRISELGVGVPGAVGRTWERLDPNAKKGQP